MSEKYVVGDCYNTTNCCGKCNECEYDDSGCEYDENGEAVHPKESNTAYIKTDKVREALAKPSIRDLVEMGITAEEYIKIAIEIISYETDNKPSCLGILKVRILDEIIELKDVLAFDYTYLGKADLVKKELFPIEYQKYYNLIYEALHTCRFDVMLDECVSENLDKINCNCEDCEFDDEHCIHDRGSLFIIEGNNV